MLGRPAKAYQYDAYGAILAEQGPSLTDEFAYTARSLHDRSGLYYYRARFYSPELGRFITQDPIGYIAGANLYAYALSDPVNHYDPLGLKTIIVAEDVLPIAGEGGDVLRFRDTRSFADAVARIPAGESEVIIISHGDPIGGIMNIGSKKVQGPDITSPLKNANLSEEVKIDLRVCYLLRGELGKNIKCELMNAFPRGDIIAHSGRVNYCLGISDLLPYAISNIFGSPCLILTPEGP